MKTLMNLSWILGLVMTFSLYPSASAWSSGLSLKIVYDNTAYDPDMTEHWGFGCLIKYGDITILFDTGQDGGILLDNFRKMGEDPEDVDIVVISHNHGDHIGGLYDFLEVNQRAQVFILDPSPEDLSRLYSMGIRVIPTPDPVRIYRGISLSGAMGQGIREQALVIDTPAGLILVVGCSHPGVLNMISKARELFHRPVYMVIGGFHTMPGTSEGMEQVILDFMRQGVVKVAPGHCTNEQAKAWFKQAYRQNYIQIGVGRELHFRPRRP